MAYSLKWKEIEQRRILEMELCLCNFVFFSLATLLPLTQGNAKQRQLTKTAFVFVFLFYLFIYLFSFKSYFVCSVLSPFNLEWYRKVIYSKLNSLYIVTVHAITYSPLLAIPFVLLTDVGSHIYSSTKIFAKITNNNK